MIKLIDFTGKIIVPGDAVITIAPGYKNLCYGFVDKVCEKMLRIKSTHYHASSFYRYPKEVVVRTNELNSL